MSNVESSTVFKILHDGDLRRWRVSEYESIPFAEFKDKVCELYGLKAGDATIKYEDEDGDKVTLARDRDILEMSRQELKIIRLTVYKNVPPKSDATRVAPSVVSSDAVEDTLPTKPKAKDDKIKEKLLKTLKKELKEAKAAKIPKALKKERKSEIKTEIKNLKNQAPPGASPGGEQPASPAPSIEDALSGLLAPWLPIIACHCPEAASMLQEGNVTTCISGVLEALKASPWGPLLVPALEKIVSEASASATAASGVVAAAAAAADASCAAGGSAADPGCPPPTSGFPPAAPPSADSAAPPSADSATPSPAVHYGVSCDGCGMSPIIGPRYKAITRHDFDVCTACEAKGGEWSSEHFVCIDNAGNGGWLRGMRGFHGRGFGGFGAPCFGGGAAARCAPGRFGGGRFGANGVSGAAPAGSGGPKFGPGGPGPSGPWKENKQAWKDARAFGKGKIMRHEVGVGGTPGMDARYVRDVALFDGTEVPAGASITKIWRLRNTGSHPWTQDRTFLRHVGGDDLGAPRAMAVPLPEALAPGEEMDISVDMTAPLKPGRYVSHYRLAVEPTGAKFGHRVWAMINVVDPASAPGSSLEDKTPPPVTPVREADTVADEEDSCDEEICCDPDGCCEGGNGEPKSCCGPAAAPAPWPPRTAPSPVADEEDSCDEEICCDPDGCCEGGNGEPKSCCGPAAAPEEVDIVPDLVASVASLSSVPDLVDASESESDNDDDEAVAEAAKLFLPKAAPSTPSGGGAGEAEPSSARGQSLMKEMGFDDEELNSLLLDKHSGNVELAISEMADRLASAPKAEDADWDILSGSDTEPSAGGFNG